MKKRSSKEAKTVDEEKKKAEPKKAGVRRKTKEVEKATKQSERIRGKPKVEYNINVLEKTLSQQEAGNGCIEVMLAHNYDPDKHNPKGWLMSEKLDGVRCYWNGSTMYTRNGNPFFAPDWWKAKLPKVALDGELWSKRDDFQKIVSIVRRQDKDNENWKKIKFMIFDAPLIKGTFKQRLAKLNKEIEKDPNEVVEMVK